MEHDARSAQMVSQTLKNIRTACVSAGLFAVFVVIVLTQPLFQLTTESLVKAKLVCSLGSASLEARSQTITKHSGLPCYNMLLYEFDNFSFFYVGESMETLVGLGFATLWAVLTTLALSTLCLILKIRYKSVTKTVASFFAGFAGFLSLVAMILLNQATGESKVADRYGYSQTPSIKVTGWVPIFPLLQLIVIWHFDDILEPTKLKEKVTSWGGNFRSKFKYRKLPTNC